MPSLHPAAQIRPCARAVFQERSRPDLRLLTVLVLFAALTACMRLPESLAPAADPADLPPIGGDYAVRGVDPDGYEYIGRMRIMPSEAPGEYLLEWIINGSAQQGLGRIAGNHLQVRWRSVPGSGRDAGGMIDYTITEAGELTGPRLTDGVDRASIETAYPIR